MKYNTLHINDSGAIEDSDESIADGKKTLISKMYNDSEFNQLNDILHSTDDYIMNKKALQLFLESEIIPFEIRDVIVRRKESKFGILKKYRNHEYKLLRILQPQNLICYQWINYATSQITIKKGEAEIGKLESHANLLKLISENQQITQQVNKIYSSNLSTLEKEETSKNLKSYSWETKKIIISKRFDQSVDLFKIPFYSWGTYISERLKEKLIMNNIKDIRFAETNNELGPVWKQHYPTIEFDAN